VVYRFQAPLEYDRYLIDKGSIAIDGISLTVVKPQQGQFDVWVIPHTLEMTNLGVLNVGNRVNLEFDMVARYIEKLLAATAVLPSA
jgi:riboflavin synthase